MSAEVKDQNNIDEGGGYDLEIFINQNEASNYICAMYDTFSYPSILTPKYHILIDI